MFLFDEIIKNDYSFSFAEFIRNILFFFMFSFLFTKAASLINKIMLGIMILAAIRK